MRYQTKLFITGACLLISSLFASGIAYWGVEQSRHLLERARLAHLQLENYLSLSRHAYQAFHHVAEATLGTGQSALRPGNVSSSESQLYANIEALRSLIAREVKLVPESEKGEEAEELSRLAHIEAQARAAMQKLSLAESLNREGRGFEARLALAGSLSQAMNGWLGQLIESAIADEINEVWRTDKAAMQLLGQLKFTTQANAASAVLIVCVALFFLLRRLQRPLAQLMAGTRAIAADDLSHRIAITGSDEFAVLGRQFNEMAAELEDKRQALRAAQADLEAKVAMRTRELEKANRTLERADQARRHFFADISHELRTPLTIIRGEAQVSLRGNNKSVEDLKSSLSKIAEESQHLTKLVDDMLYMAREAADAVPMKKEPVYISKLLAQICNQIESIAAERQIDIRCTPGIGDETAVLGDPARLRQVMLIVLDNAMRYSPSGSDILIETVETPGSVSVRVADHGLGIEPSELEHVFERFHRGATANNHNTEGIGLGLPLAKAIMEAHRGDIAIQSEPRKGTTVTLTLPLLQDVEGAA